MNSEVLLWYGKPIAGLTRDELEKALIKCCKDLQRERENSRRLINNLVGQ